MIDESRKRTGAKPKKRYETKGWSPERRKMQRRLIRKQKPWLKSTGPRSAEGKYVSRFNAVKHGSRMFVWRELRRVLARHRRFLRDLKRFNIKLPRYPEWYQPKSHHHLKSPSLREGEGEGLESLRKENIQHPHLTSPSGGGTDKVSHRPADFAELHQMLAKRYTVIHED